MTMLIIAESIVFAIANIMHLNSNIQIQIIKSLNLVIIIIIITTILYHKFVTSTIHRALIFQGGGSLGAYEAGAYKAIHESLSRSFKNEGRENEPIFHIVSGTSIGAINSAILVS